MKRFLVFTYDTYYPTGGVNDLSGDVDSLEEAYALATGMDCADILDTKTGASWTRVGHVWRQENFGEGE